MSAASVLAGEQEPAETEEGRDLNAVPAPGGEADPAAVAPLVSIDVRRPWPHCVPSQVRALEALGGTAASDSSLQPLNDEVVALLPPHLLDAVRTSVAGYDDALGVATAAAWRALVAARLLDGAIGVDLEAVPPLIHDTVDAREKILAAAIFSLDGAETTEPLATALATVIERLTERVRLKVARPSAGSKKSKVRAVLTPARAARGLRLVFAFAMLLLLNAHLDDLFSHRAERRGWVVVGDVERGHAFLAPATPNADQASLQRALQALEAEGLEARRMPSGEWVVARKGSLP